MALELKRPVVIFDLETTGVNITTDRIIEIALIKILPSGEQIRKRKLINPQMPVPAGAVAVHGISDEMLKDAPTFKAVANELKQFLDGCDLGGYNSNRFDIPLLVEEFLRAGIDFTMDGRKMIDVQRIFHLMEQRTLAAAYKFYCGKVLEDAHSAEADAHATWEILCAQVVRYPNIGTCVDAICSFTGEEEIVDFSRRFVFDNGVEVFNFGKHKGKPVADVLRDEPQYYDWMMKGEFSLHTKQKLTEIFNRVSLKQTVKL